MRGDVHDPAAGSREVSLAEFSKHFTGVALELAPAADFRPANERRSVPLRSLLGTLPPLRS